MSKNDGGSAFPVLEKTRPYGDIPVRDAGMTLRDWFAGL